MANPGQRLAAEGLGTAFLPATVVGSGIRAERLAGGNVALALLANALTTGGGLVALILTFSGIAGAHFTPAVSLAMALRRELSGRDGASYTLVQILGAFCSVVAAHLRFGEPWFFASQYARAAVSQWWSEFVAPFGLLAMIVSTSRHRPETTPFAVAAYIVGAYRFIASFANPAVTLARATSDTFAGIRPTDVPGFIVAQILGAVAATAVFGWMLDASEPACSTKVSPSARKSWLNS